jgi:hypothetical protein
MREEGGLTQSDSGLASRKIQSGRGKVKPSSDSDDIQLHVIGRSPHKDLAPFLNTYRGMQKGMTKWKVENFPPGVREVLKTMVPGDIYWAVMPYELSFGEDGIEGRVPGYSATSWTLELLSVNGDDGGYTMANELPPKRRFRLYEIEEEKRRVEEARKRGVSYTPKIFLEEEEDEDEKWYTDFEERQEEMKKRFPRPKTDDL